MLIFHLSIHALSLFLWLKIKNFRGHTGISIELVPYIKVDLNDKKVSKTSRWSILVYRLTGIILVCLYSDSLYAPCRYHPACVKMTTVQAKKLSNYLCDDCTPEQDRKNSPGQVRLLSTIFTSCVSFVCLFFLFYLCNAVCFLFVIHIFHNMVLPVCIYTDWR